MTIAVLVLAGAVLVLAGIIAIATAVWNSGGGHRGLAEEDVAHLLGYPMWPVHTPRNGADRDDQPLAP